MLRKMACFFKGEKKGYSINPLSYGLTAVLNSLTFFPAAMYRLIHVEAVFLKRSAKFSNK